MSVDDSKLIGQVIASMGNDPSLSRRQAIIRVAGEDSLRRIEMKLKRIEDEGELAAQLRSAIAARHADDHPMTSSADGGATSFSVVLSWRGPTGVSIAADDAVGAVYEGKNAARADCWPETPYEGEMYRAFCALGLAWPIRNSVIDRSDATPPFLTALAERLAEAWMAVPAAVADLGPSGIATLAIETETARADRAGYALLMARWSSAIKDAATVLGSRTRTWGKYPDLVRRCLRDGAWSAAVAAAGPLVEVMFERGEDVVRLKPDEAPEQAFARAVYLSDLWVEVERFALRRADASDVAWLRETFGGLPMAAIPDEALKAILKLRFAIEPARLPDIASRAALPALLRERYQNWSDHFTGRMVLEEAHRTEGSYEDFRAGVAALAGETGSAFDDALGLVCVGWDAIATSLRQGVGLPLMMARMGTFGPDDVPETTSLSEIAECMLPGRRRSAEDPFVAAMVAGRPALDTAGRVLAWRDAGRPGQQPSSPYSLYADTHFTRSYREIGTVEDARAAYAGLRPYLADPTTDFDAFAEAIVAASRTPGEVLHDWDATERKYERKHRRRSYVTDTGNPPGRLRRALAVLLGREVEAPAN